MEMRKVKCKYKMPGQHTCSNDLSNVLYDHLTEHRFHGKLWTGKGIRFHNPCCKLQGRPRKLEEIGCDKWRVSVKFIANNSPRLSERKVREKRCKGKNANDTVLLSDLSKLQQLATCAYT